MSCKEGEGAGKGLNPYQQDKKAVSVRLGICKKSPFSLLSR